MILFSLQTVLLLAAGFALFRLWRAAMPSERWLRLAVAAGFLARAILGQALFWISWAHLPVARSLQLGNGFWVFAQDALWYFPEAVSAAGKGLGAIVMFDRVAASVMYVQVLSTFVWLFGSAVSVALLINLFSYLGTVAILVQWGRKQPRTATAVAIAIAAIAFSPSFVLWSLQPLKDPFFQLLFVAFVAACAAWQRAWLAPGRWAARLGIGALLIVLVFALAGIRWYFAAVLVVAAALFMLLVVFQAVERRGVCLAAAAAVAFLLSQSLAVSAAPYLPLRVKAMLNPKTALTSVKTAPASLIATVENARRGFDLTAASTMIRSGKRLAAKPAPAPPTPPPVVAVVTQPPPQPTPVVTPPAPKPTPKPAIAVAKKQEVTPPPAVAAAPAPPPVIAAAPPPPPAPVAVTPSLPPETTLPAEDAAEVRALMDAQVAAWNDHDVAQFLNRLWQSPEFELKTGGNSLHGWQQMADYVNDLHDKKLLGRLEIDKVVTSAQLDGAAVFRATWTITSDRRAPLAGWWIVVLRRFPEGWKIVRMVVPPTPEPQSAPVAVAAPPPPQPQPPVATTTIAAAPVVPVKKTAKPKAVASKPVAPPPAPAPAPPPVVPPPPRPAFTAADAAQIHALLAAQTAAWNSNDLARYLATFARAPEPELADGTRTVRGWQPLYDYYRKTFADGLGRLAYSNLRADAAADGGASVTGRCTLTGAGGDGRMGDVTMQLRRFPDGWKVVRATLPAIHIDERESQPRGRRLLSGAAVLIFPRSVGERLGLFRVGGGRGMLWFTEIDTIVFDVVLLCALLALAVRSSAPWRNPMTWLVLLITLLIAGPLIYSVSNFGTLFRLREMIYIGLLLIPLAVAARAETPVHPSN